MYNWIHTGTVFHLFWACHCTEQHLRSIVTNDNILQDRMFTFNIITFNIILGHDARDFAKDIDICVINLSSLQMLYPQIQVHQQQTKWSFFCFLKMNFNTITSYESK